MSVLGLDSVSWALLATGALIVGFAKTAIGNGGSVAVVLFAVVLPARESTGALLPLLLVGDVLAIRLYHRSAHWATVRRLLPGVLPGLLLGALFLAVADDAMVRHAIGAILLVMTVLGLVRMRTRVPMTTMSHPRAWVTGTAGIAAGFATMTANAAGPVTTIYLLMAGLRKLDLLGTAAWFYFIVNLTKLPFSLGLGLVSWRSVGIDVLLLPSLVVGGGLGAALIRRVGQRQFETIALLLGGIAASLLLI